MFQSTPKLHALPPSSLVTLIPDFSSPTRATSFARRLAPLPRTRMWPASRLVALAGRFVVLTRRLIVLGERSLLPSGRTAVLVDGFVVFDGLLARVLPAAIPRGIVAFPVLPVVPVVPENLDVPRRLVVLARRLAALAGGKIAVLDGRLVVLGGRLSVLVGMIEVLAVLCG